MITTLMKIFLNLYKMNIQVNRFERTKDYTISRVTLKDYKLNNYTFYAIEPPVHYLKAVKPYAIPCGTYKLLYTWSHRLKKNTWQVMNVPGFEGIRVHSGNYAKDTLGCLILGTKENKDHVENSRVAVDMFNDILSKLKEPITITYIETNV